MSAPTSAEKTELPPAVLHSIFRADFDKGFLYWKERPLDWFPNVRTGRIWNTKWAGKIAYFSTNLHGYSHVRTFNRLRKVHRIIFAMYHGYYPIQVDHINGKRTDNRISNLRAVNNQTNALNKRMPAQNSSGEVGVYYHKRTGRWGAQAQISGRIFNFGTFATFDEASAANKAGRAQLGFHQNHGRAQ